MDLSTVAAILGFVTQYGVTGLALIMWWIARMDLKEERRLNRSDMAEIRSKQEAVTKDSITAITNNSSVLGMVVTIFQPKRRG